MDLVELVLPAAVVSFKGKTILLSVGQKLSIQFCLELRDIECFVSWRENVYRGKVFDQIIIQTYLITYRQCEQVVDEKNGLKHSSPHFVGQHKNIECLVTNLTNI